MLDVGGRLSPLHYRHYVHYLHEIRRRWKRLRSFRAETRDTICIFGRRTNTTVPRIKLLFLYCTGCECVSEDAPARNSVAVCGYIAITVFFFFFFFCKT